MITKHSGQQEGLKLDFTNDYFQIGDFAGTNNGTYLIIDDDNQFIQSYNQKNEIGLKLNFPNKYYQLGDYDNVNNGSAFHIDDTNRSIFTSTQGAQQGIILDFLNGTYYFGNTNGVNQLVFELNRFTSLGDYNGLGSETIITLDDVNKYINLTTNSATTSFLIDGGSDKMTFTTNSLNYVGTSLTDGATVVPVNKNLLVTINGTTYHIPLYN